jgi:colanic acid biosynthesis glycosyl transferase WcaI
MSAIATAPLNTRDREVARAAGVPGRPTALVFYHYLYPDEVVSSVLLTQLCTGLTERGWQVMGSACNRGYEDAARRYPQRSVWENVEFLRIWRPGLKQSESLGRLLNALWMICAWSLLALNPRIRPDVIIVGSDPVLSLVTALAWRIFRPRVRVAHWCFDLYPDARLADGLIGEGSLLARLLKAIINAGRTSAAT